MTQFAAWAASLRFFALLRIDSLSVTLSPVSSDVMVFGEVGLSGEVRAVTGASLRVQEAKRLGFNTVILPKSCLKGLDKFDGIKIIGVESVSDVVDLI